jgi:hypothetical protein
LSDLMLIKFQVKGVRCKFQGKAKPYFLEP